MEQVQIFWDPNGIELEQLGKKTKSGDPADGDTPYVRMPIRMLGIDTPETNYQGGEATANTDRCRAQSTAPAKIVKCRNPANQPRQPSQSGLQIIVG